MKWEHIEDTLLFLQYIILILFSAIRVIFNHICAGNGTVSRTTTVVPRTVWRSTGTGCTMTCPATPRWDTPANTRLDTVKQQYVRLVNVRLKDVITVLVCFFLNDTFLVSIFFYIIMLIITCMLYNHLVLLLSFVLYIFINLFHDCTVYYVYAPLNSLLSLVTWDNEVYKCEETD